MQKCDSCNGRGTFIDKPCQNCKGLGKYQKTRRIKVKIPAGVDEESSLRLKGEGDAGPAGTPSGDLYIVIHIKPHKFFVRKGDDIYYETKVSFHLLALGGEIKVPTLEGEKIFKIPPGSQSETIFRLRGLGMPSLRRHFGLRRHNLGDELIKVSVQIPKNLTDRQKQILEEFAKETS